MVSLNGTPYIVIGVMPESFRFQGGSDFLFSPLDISEKDLQDRSGGMLSVHRAAAAGGRTVEDATHELAGIKQQNLRAYPGKERDNRIVVESYAHLLTRNVRPGLLALNGLVLAVWLLATINVAGLLLTRTQGRRREIAVRAAVGARMRAPGAAVPGREPAAEPGGRGMRASHHLRGPSCISRPLSRQHIPERRSRPYRHNRRHLCLDLHLAFRR